MKVFMRRIALALIVVGAVAIAAILPSVIESGPNWEERMRELERTYPFISVHDEGGYYSQSIDKDAAERAGISKKTFLLASEMLDYQNRLAFEAYRSETLDIPMVEVELREFPKVEELFEEATKKAEEKETEERRIDGLSLQIGPFRIGGESVANAHSIHIGTPSPCGSFFHQIPEDEPPEEWVEIQNPRTVLVDDGYHRTSPRAACYRLNCSRDYTRPTSHTTSDHTGTCPEPFFRDHGWVDTSESGYTYQLGEPNPESAFMNPLRWPYLFWGAYVAWWHGTDAD